MHEKERISKEYVPFALTTSNLSVIYEKTTALWDVNLQIPQGKLIAILGPNGAGKSTFIKAVLGLVKPLTGSVSIFEKPLKDAKGRIAYVPQREAVDWDFPITVEELVLMGRYPQLGLFGWVKKKDWELVHSTLEKVGLSQFAKRQISQLSGGQQQRAFIARCLIQDADVYFMDEPLAGVDHASELIIMQQLSELQQNGKTVFVVHHDLNTVEKYFQWIVLFNVRLIAYGSVKSAFTKHNLSLAYGKNFALLDEALHLSQSKLTGMV